MNEQRIVNCLLDATKTILELKNENEKLEQRIDKANEILSKSCFEYDNCPDNVINEIIELKEILGDKENE